MAPPARAIGAKTAIPKTRRVTPVPIIAILARLAELAGGLALAIKEMRVGPRPRRPRRP